MSVATITRTFYTSPTSQATFLSMLDSAMLSAGFTVFNSKLIGTTENKIYVLTVSPAVKGTVYLRMQLTNAQSMSARLSMAWDSSNNVATNEGTASSLATFSFTSLQTINFIAINSAELKGVLITQGTVSYLLGVIRPANIETWYDESQFSLAFTADNANNPNIYGTTLIPNTTGLSWITNYSDGLTNVNPFASNTRQVKPVEFYHPSRFGSTAFTSADLVWAATSGISGTGTDELITNSATYLYLGKSTGNTCALAVRIA